MDINQLYVKQMKLWFEEQERISKSCARAVEHHEEMAQLNREQLRLNDKRIEITLNEYNVWAAENGFPAKVALNDISLDALEDGSQAF